ncbi:MAG: hypothetical protein ABSC50_08010 [Candidatus Bathyarchaeia archaeon]
MSSEPRMRGTRFRRPSTKKHSKERREERQTSVFYQEATPIDPSQVSSKILNALGHLGTQRFALPPFSEHFERWIKDVEAVLTELETELPNMADQPYRVNVQNVLSSLREALRKQIQAEKDSSGDASKLLQELNTCQLELSKLEHEYGTQTYNARKRNERTVGKLKGEIDVLDNRRLKLLRKRPSIIERILHRPGPKLEESTSALQSKRTEFDMRGTLLQHELDELRANFDVKSKHLRERQEGLKAKLAEFNRNTSNDALEVRNAACQELRLEVTQALDRSSKAQITANPKNTQ